MTNSPRWIRRFHKPRAATNPPLVICPHAGGNAGSYRRFSRSLAEHFEVVVLQYPGRQDRAAEPIPPTLPDTAAAAFAEFTDTPLHHAGLTVFGHSMGAIVAFEFTRLAEAAGMSVRLLGASGAVAPWQVVDQPPHPTEDDVLLGHLGFLGGTGTEALADPELMRLALPALKADYAAFDTYCCSQDTTVAADIHVMGGSADDCIGIGDLFAWQAHTPHTLTATMFDGGHFYLHDHIGPMTTALSAGNVAVP